MPHKTLPCLSNHARSHLLGVAGGGLGGGSLGLGGDDPLLVKSLEEGFDNGTISDLSTLQKADQSQFGSNQRGK